MSPIAEKTPEATATIPQFKISDTNNLAVLKKLCTFLTHHALVTTTRPPLPTRYPQFLGAEKASIRAAVLDEFRAAKVVLVSPGVAVLSDTVLQQGKTLVSPTPGLREEKVFQKLIKNEKESVEGVREPKYTRLELAKDVKIDVLVVGSMLVDKMGRRVGKKREQVGLEFVLGGLSAQKKLVVITLVHDCQVVDEVPESLFSSMDVPVDIIVTPTKVIRVKDRLARPNSILWNKVTEIMMENIPMLESVRNKDKEAGKDVELAISAVEGLKKDAGLRNSAGEMVMGCKMKFQSLPRDLKYSELREVLKVKVEPGFKIGVLKFGMAVAYFKESSSEVIEKLKGFTIEDKKVEMEEMEILVKEAKEAKNPEDVVRRQKVEMKSKFKFVNVGDAKSVDLKKALIDRNVHFGFLKIFKNSGVAIVLFQEDGAEVKEKINGLILGENKLEFEELDLGEKRQRSSPSPKRSRETRSPKKASKELKLKEMKSKFKFRNLGRVKVSALKEILRECKVEPGFVVVYMKFGVAIVMFKEMSKEMAMKLKGLKVAESKIEFEEIELESKRITRSKKVSESDKKQGRSGSRKRTLSQKFFEKGLAGIFIGSLPRDVTAAEIKEAVGKKHVDAAHIELIGRKGFAFAYFDKKPEDEDLLKKLKDLKVKERLCKVEVMRSPPRNSGSGDDMVAEPKVKGIVAKDKRINVERTSPTSRDEKVGSKKTSSGDEKPRSKKSSSSEGEEQAKRTRESKPKSDISLGKEKTVVNKARPVKTARGT
jgi:5-formyltetrahydrofolate cyclo-ligase